MMLPRPLLLASVSPQRAAILAQLGIPFRVMAPRYDERALPLGPLDLVRAHALGKAESVVPGPGDGPVIGVDTAVVTPDGAILGKPTSASEAAAMLDALAGREHVVVSGLAVRADGATIVRDAVTTVRFRALGTAERTAYVATGEWVGRAGGYAIQGRGALLVASVDGCYLNVVGLPVAVLVEVLAGIGYPVLQVARVAADPATPCGGSCGTE